MILGSQLSLAQIAKVGLESLPVMLGTLVVCLAAAWLIGRWLGITGDLRTLIGVGTGICGASAIAAVTPVIGAVSIDVAYAISAIFLFNIAAVLAFPLLGHLLGLSQHAFGLFAGTAVNDMSSVVATATTYGAAATNFAVVVKLVRILMIIPITLALASGPGRRRRSGRESSPASERIEVLPLVPDRIRRRHRDQLARADPRRRPSATERRLGVSHHGRVVGDRAVNRPCGVPAGRGEAPDHGSLPLDHRVRDEPRPAVRYRIALTRRGGL